MLNVTTCAKDSSPALWNSTSFLYTTSGEEPVGRPSTKGRSAVGPKARMRFLMYVATQWATTAGSFRMMRRILECWPLLAARED